MPATLSQALWGWCESDHRLLPPWVSTRLTWPSELESPLSSVRTPWGGGRGVWSRAGLPPSPESSLVRALLTW